MTRNAVALLAVAAAAACARSQSTSAPPSPNSAARSTATARPADGAALVRQMHVRYDGKWYRSLSFIQDVIFADGRPTETWKEVGVIPGRLRIDHQPLDSGNATIYSGDSAYTFRAGRLANVRRDRNLLLTLGFDVYGQDAETTAAQLRTEGIDVSMLSEGSWQGRPVWIVGAMAGDTSSSQFWVEKERLLFVRLIQRTTGRNGQVRMLEAQFNKYQPLGRAWVAPECVVRLDGKDYFREVYRNIIADPVIPPDLFDTRTYHRPA